METFSRISLRSLLELDKLELWTPLPRNFNPVFFCIISLNLEWVFFVVEKSLNYFNKKKLEVEVLGMDFVAKFLFLLLKS